MLTGILRAALLLLTVIACGCEGPPIPPAGPNPPPPDGPNPPPQTQSTPPTFDLSPFVGVWNLTLHLTEVKGDSGCIAEAMKSQLEVPSKSSLTITQSSVTITNPSGDYACTFDSFKTDSSSFTTYGVQGWFTCQSPLLAVRCSDGSTYDLFSMGQDISARLSGTEISGTWDAGFDDNRTGVGFGITAEFKGSK